MKFLTKANLDKLLENGSINEKHRNIDGNTVDHKPVVKFFNPVGAATWLISELDADGDTMFGLCDLGFNSPEMGSVSLRELRAVQLSFGLKIERDLHFKADKTLTAYADEARTAGRIMA